MVINELKTKSILAIKVTLHYFIHKASFRYDMEKPQHFFNDVKCNTSRTFVARRYHSFTCMKTVAIDHIISEQQALKQKQMALQYYQSPVLISSMKTLSTLVNINLALKAII